MTPDAMAGVLIAGFLAYSLAVLCARIRRERGDMETREYAYVDKSSWPDGPWKGEPDKIQWTDEATGLPCLVVRGPVGALCGYVGVAEGHPSFGVNHDGVDVDVHGGLTFSSFCQENEHGICHIPGPGEPDRVWWLGFDCAHLSDVTPRHDSRILFEHAVYRDLAYVRDQCAQLAVQLKALVRS